MLSSKFVPSNEDPTTPELCYTPFVLYSIQKLTLITEMISVAICLRCVVVLGDIFIAYLLLSMPTKEF